MLRDARAADNWALLFARGLAAARAVPLRVVYALPPPPDDDDAVPAGDDGAPPRPADLPLTARHGTFLLDGLKVVAADLAAAGVPFDVLRPPARAAVGAAVRDHAVGAARVGGVGALAVVCDMSPLRLPRACVEAQAAPLLEEAGVPLYQVDAHNVVPVWTASPKREVGARTLRPKIHAAFSRYGETRPHAFYLGRSNSNACSPQVPHGVSRVRGQPPLERGGSAGGGKRPRLGRAPSVPESRRDHRRGGGNEGRASGGTGAV